MQAQAHIQTETQNRSTSRRPILKLVPPEERVERQDVTLAATADDPALLGFYTRILPRGIAPAAGIPFFPCA